MAKRKFVKSPGETMFGKPEKERGKYNPGEMRLARGEHAKVIVFDMAKIGALSAGEKKVFDECVAEGKRIPEGIFRKVATVKSADAMIKGKLRGRGKLAE